MQQQQQEADQDDDRDDPFDSDVTSEEDEDENGKNNRKPHERRFAADIERMYDCPYKCCDKQYGSEGSMNLHIKIKHLGGNKTEREKAAKHIVWCHAQPGANYNINVKEILAKINLPPGSIKDAAEALQI